MILVSRQEEEPQTCWVCLQAALGKGDSSLLCMVLAILTHVAAASGDRLESLRQRLP